MNDVFALGDNGKPLTWATTRTSADRELWLTADDEEIVRLVDDTQTMCFIDANSKPRDRLASYYNPQVKMKMKDGVIVRRTRGTYGGNRSDYYGDKSAQTADMQTVKIMLNAAVSEDAELLILDIDNFYLGTYMERKEYMWLSRHHLSPAMIERYGASIVWYGDRCMVRVDKGIYGLPKLES
jgi:hypothetical protein